jgi:hypothetical protein
MTLPGGQKIWCNTYVDDLFLAANPGPIKDKIIAELKAFEIKDLGILRRPLGMELEYDTEKGSCTLHQAALIRDLLSGLQAWPSSCCCPQGSTTLPSRNPEAGDHLLCWGIHHPGLV